LAQATQASPRTPSPTKLPSRALAFNGSPKQKENANARLSPARNIGNLTERPHNVQSSDTVTIKDLWSAPSKSPPKTAANLASNIPTLKGSPRPLSLALAPAPVFGTPAFSEITNPRKEAGPTNIPSPTKSPQKLRLQSPQKLRERLQSEAKAIGEAEAGLQSELAKIGAEMAKLSGSPVRGTPSSSGSELRRISESVRALESRIPVIMKDLEGRNAAVQKELDRGLVVAEEKAKGLDQLYREVSAENEILYERFNGELGRIVKALKGKGREEREELVKKVKESSEEAAAVRKENARLKREILGLKALVKGSALCLSMTVSLRAYLNTYNHQVNLRAWTTAANLQLGFLLETEQISAILVPYPPTSSNGLLAAHKLRERRLIRMVRQETLTAW
ncbi:hypothetical protein O988_09676, partial [Pseudogymnoascus sp. VKM F-3808]